MSRPVHIVACGARTSLGLRAASSAAAYRAGLSAAREHPHFRDAKGSRLITAFDQALDVGVTGSSRWLTVADTALREACAAASLPREQDVPLMMALPGIRPGWDHAQVAAIRSAIASSHDLRLCLLESTMPDQGHAGGLALIGAAAQRIDSGELALCLVGGVDSYADGATMRWLADNRRLSDASVRLGFVPGEAAAFVLLMSESVMNQWGLHSQARVVASAVGRETRTITSDEPCLGEGLSSTIGLVLDQLSSRPGRFDAVICDINGERYRSEEWGFTCLRHSAAFVDPTDYWSPADCWGDCGAASGPLFAVLACQAIARGYARGSRTLLWAASDDGLRAAVVLDSPSAART
jgi:3-oxoacyl-[acyl-carrier-protein] synthase I